MTPRRITAADPEQFEQLCQRSRRRAYKLAYRLTGNASEAEDILQDAYMRAWQNFAAFDSTRSFEGWLFRIIMNRVYDLHRRQRRVQIFSLDRPAYQEADGTFAHLEYADPAANPEEIVISPVLEERLETALLRLPETYRRAMLLCVVEERSYREVADILNCAVGTVRSRLHRARRLMRHDLETGSSVRVRQNASPVLQPSAIVV